MQRWLVALAALPSFWLTLNSQEPGTVFFETKIRPALTEHCLDCHSSAKSRGGLSLEYRGGWQKGGDSGPAIVPGNPDASLLIQTIRHAQGKPQMPSKAAALPTSVIRDFENWVAMGAPDPRAEPATPDAGKGEDSGPKLRPRKFELSTADKSWWAFQPITRPPVPQVDPSATRLDQFVLARLKAKGIEPNRPASRRELIRRVYFDLLGIPPTFEAVRRFEEDSHPDAWSRLIDDLLARPQYGERWARHWLDVVRYAESNGYERDGAKPFAWRYRDYVIRSLNSDKPYDQFVTEQLAGDEMESGFDPDKIIATGFFRLHVWDDEPDSTLAAEFDDLDDMMVTTSGAFLGLTLGCARCHDHKYDPISQQDYYRTLACFRSINPYGLHKTGGGGRGIGKITRPLAPMAAVRDFEAAKAGKIKDLKSRLAETKDEKLKKQIQDEIRGTESDPGFEQALAIVEDPIKPTHLLKRGVAQSPGEEVQPGIPVVFGTGGFQIKPPAEGLTSGRRLALARWMTQRENPLTARVIVNRLWQHHFGSGIVPTPNDFGRTGQKPSNLELLDFLASELVDGGYRLKRLHKLILMSHAYQCSSWATNIHGLRVDESNSLFWRQNPRRLEAEVLRDSILSFSGELNFKMGGPGMFPALAKVVHGTQDSEGKGWQQSPVSEQNRRSIYIFIKRALIPPLLDVFDYNTTTVPVAERPVTTVAPQALMLLNDEFVQIQSAHFASRLLREFPDVNQALIQRAFEIVLQRRPTTHESDLALTMLNQQRRFATEARPDGETTRNAVQRFCVALLNLNETIYAD